MRVPRNWHKVYNHNYIGHTPIPGPEGYYYNGIKVFYWQEEKMNLSLEELVKKRFNGTNKNQYLNVIDQNVSIDTTKYGKTFTYKYHTKMNGNERITISKFFQYKEILYQFYGISDLKYFMKYKDDHEFIFNNLKFID